MEQSKRQSRSGRPFALTLFIAGALFIAAPISAWAAHLGGTTGDTSPRRAEDVRNTMHNLSTSNPIAGTNINAGGTPTTEVCVFCHTPHGANVNTAGAPLWNRALPTTASGYTMYSSPNFDVAIPGQPTGVSLACLSCHDGVAALDAFINAGGSGGFRNQPVGVGTSAGAISKPSGSDLLDTNLSMSDLATRTDTGPNYGTITGGAKPFPNLTQDLTDDHPISFPIPSTDPQFDTLTFVPDGQINKIVRTGEFSPVDRRDALRTYPPSGTATMSGNGWIECASCHNPHAPRPLFLRLPNKGTAGIEKGGGTTSVGGVIGGTDATVIADKPNAGSAVCLSCHEK